MTKKKKNPAAVILGRLGGLKGGKARAKKLSPERRSEIARNAANIRWKGKKMKDVFDKESDRTWNTEADNKREGKGGTRKIADPPPDPCMHPEHNFPGMLVLEPGAVYEHICPQCGARQLRREPKVYM